jgi:hypothetical protein
MILIGTMDWPQTVDSGVFYCPVCDGSQKYRRRTSRPFLTVYFIPVVPIGGLQEYVECMHCKTNFELGILGDPTPEAERSFHSDLLKAAALTMLEDQKVTEPEIRMALTALRLLGDMQVSRDDLGQACSVMRSRQLSLCGFLWTARERLIPEERARMVQLVFLIAGAEGQISSARMNSLIKCQEILGLKTAEFEQCVSEAEQIVTMDKGSSR